MARRGMWALLIALFLTGIGIGYLAGASTSQTIRVVVNGLQIYSDPPWRVEANTLVGPIKPIANALALKTEWDYKQRVLTVKSVSPWLIIEHPKKWMQLYPYDMYALGPMLTVRHHLAELQWKSLTAPDKPGDPLLARYEIIDVQQLYEPKGKDIPFTDKDVGEFSVRAILYWATMNPKRTMPRPAAGYLRVTGNSIQQGQYRYGPALQQMRAITMTYRVKPNDTTVFVPNDVKFVGAPQVEGVMWGQTGWTIAGEEVISTREGSLELHNEMLPMYDLSAQKFYYYAYGL